MVGPFNNCQTGIPHYGSNSDSKTSTLMTSIRHRSSPMGSNPKTSTETFDAGTSSRPRGLQCQDSIEEAHHRNRVRRFADRVFHLIERFARSSFGRKVGAALVWGLLTLVSGGCFTIPLEQFIALLV